MRPLRILLVEDHFELGEALNAMLTVMGHVVCALVRTEAEAVLARSHCLPDLLIVDQGLAEGTGSAALLTICSDGEVPHVLMSGDPDAARHLRPSAVWVAKPFEQAELVRAIELAMTSLGPQNSAA